MTQWKPHEFGVFYPETDAYYSGMIGTGLGESNVDYPKGKIPVFGQRWSKGQNNIWAPQDPPEDPFSFTGKVSIWMHFYKTNGDRSFVGYDNIQFNDGHAVINFKVSDFILPQTNGEFNLTGVPTEHNGKYAILVGAYGTPTPTALYGLKDATSATAFKGYPITGNQVVIPVFKLNSGDRNFSSFNESPSVTGLTLIIQDEEEFDALEYAQKMKDYTDAILANPQDPPSYPISALVYTSSVQFTGGKGKASFTQGTWYNGL